MFGAQSAVPIRVNTFFRPTWQETSRGIMALKSGELLSMNEKGVLATLIRKKIKLMGKAD
jgi:hypothetical protein